MTKRVRSRMTLDELDRIALHFRLLGEPTRLKILEAVCDRER
jgi:DNA-binding transcriptional ArsR family regulator